MTDTLDQRNGENDLSHSVEQSVRANTQLLQQLLDQVSVLQQRLDSERIPTSASAAALSGGAGPAPGHVSGEDLHQSCLAERQRLLEQISELESQLEDLRHQNRELASQVADRNVRQAVSTSDASQALSWEQRKQLILRQMEEESFDAESFVANMEYDPAGTEETPEVFVDRLTRELEARNREIQELRQLLQQQSETRQGHVAIGAAAIAELVDSDELVRQERERLQLLHAEWEEKFREAEIEASLERAKLSRERQELAKRRAELDEELEHFRREMSHQQDAKHANSRRWLVKLGLCDHQ